MGIVCEIVADASSLAFEILHTLYVRWRFRSVNPEIGMHSTLYQIGPLHTPLHRDVERQLLSVRRFAEMYQAIFKLWLLSGICYKDKDGRSAGHICQGNPGPSNTTPLPRFPYEQ
jgi:hypothetical protein